MYSRQPRTGLVVVRALPYIGIVLALILTAALAGCGGGHKTVAVHRSATASTAQHSYSTPYGVQAHSPTFGLPPVTGRQSVPRPLTLIPTVEMADTVTVSAIPSWFRAVAGYTSGFWPTFAGLVARFAHAFHVSIAVNASHIARCLDVEPGDATPAQARGWVLWMLRLHVYHPCVYANLSTMPQVRAALAGILRSLYMLWDANWTYRAHLDFGYEATQWTNHGPNGENYDESTVTPAFLATKPVVVITRVVCWGPHAQLHDRTCRVARPELSRLSRARDATRRAEKRLACSKHPRSSPCPTLRQRDRYFTAKANALFHAHI